MPLRVFLIDKLCFPKKKEEGEHKAEIHHLKVEPAEVKAKMMALKQPGAPRPGEPHPPPKWQPNTELPLNREEKLISAVVEQLRGGAAEGKAAQLQLVGKLGHVTQEPDKITAKFSFLEEQSRIGGPSRPLRLGTSREPEPAGDVAGLLCWRDDHWPNLSCWRRGC